MVEVVGDVVVVVVVVVVVGLVVDVVGGLDVGGLDVVGGLEVVDGLDVAGPLEGVVAAGLDDAGLLDVVLLRVRPIDAEEGLVDPEGVVDVDEVTGDGVDDGVVSVADAPCGALVVGLDPAVRSVWTFCAAPRVIPTSRRSPPATARPATTMIGTSSRGPGSRAFHVVSGACTSVRAATRARTSMWTRPVRSALWRGARSGLLADGVSTVSMVSVQRGDWPGLSHVDQVGMESENPAVMPVSLDRVAAVPIDVTRMGDAG